MFRYAKSLGDVLYVGIDSDEKIRRDKGPTRPINCLQDRVILLEAIRYIDKVFTFNSANELELLIKSSKSDIMVIGSDWRGKEVIGEQHVKKVNFFDRIEEYSTTKIIKEIIK